MAQGVYTRYVALGDSQTEGLWDGDDSSLMIDGHHLDSMCSMTNCPPPLRCGPT